MNLRLLAASLAVLVLLSGRSARARESELDEAARESEAFIEAQTLRKGVLVVASNRSYRSALRAAKSFSRAAGIGYDSQGMVLDKKRGLIWPDDFEDEAFAGGYTPRRDDSCGGDRCVTIERSDAYPGFRPGYYLVVAGILNLDNFTARLVEAHKVARDAYVRPTKIYYGCLH